MLVASATHDPDTGKLAIFALNRELAQEQELRVDLRGFDGDLSLGSGVELHHPDLQACNTRELPDTVAPRAHDRVRMEEGGLRAVLKPGSWNVFVLSASRPTGARGQPAHNAAHA